MRDSGEALDLAAIPRVVEFLAARGVDGVLALGTTGEGILLSEVERREATEAFYSGGRRGV